MSNDKPLTARQLAEHARRIYVGRGFRIKLQHYRPLICPFEDLLPLVPDGARVLDVGCGCGLFVGLLHAVGRPVVATGFDADAGAIGVAQAMAERLPDDHRPKFVRLAAEEDWPAGPFDVVALIDVMHHVVPAHQRAVIQTAASRLSPGGILIYKDMARRPLWRAWANRLHDLLIARQWITYAPVADVEQWAASAGLTLQQSQDITRLWYAHELRVFRKA